MTRACLLALLLSLTGIANAQTLAQVEVFGRLPLIADAAISSDGARVALALTDAQGRTSVGVLGLDDGAAFSLAAPEGEQLRAVDWADDQHVSYTVSRAFRPTDVLPQGGYFQGRPGRVEFWRSGVIDLATRRSLTLTINEERPWADTGGLRAPIAGDPGFGRMLGYNGRGVLSIYRVNLGSGGVRGVTPEGANEHTIAYLMDEAGVVQLRFDSDEDTNHWGVFLYEGGQPRLLLEGVSETGAPMDIIGMLPDGRFVASERAGDADLYSLFAVDRETGALTPLFSRAGADVTSAHYDRWTGRIVGAEWASDRGGDQFFEPELQAIFERISALTAGDFVELVSWSRDRRRFLVYIERGLDGGGYYIFERASERITLLGLRYPELASIAMGERQSITYRARDGARVPAYLTYPPGGTRENLPLVLLVHGGPHARDTFDFDWWAAFLASRGYLVLQPNYRGSTGLGKAWEEAGKRQWGGLMQTDVEDGVAALVRNGVVDPARVCIVGASYGGYAALAGATLTPDRYRCAVSVAGVSDLEVMLRARAARTGGERSMASDFWRLSIGDREEDRERIRSVSPVHLADRVRVPILLIHGTDDTVVPIDQSRRMQRALRDAGKDVRFVELTGDDHWLSDAPTRIQMLRELDAFLAQHIGGARLAQ